MTRWLQRGANEFKSTQKFEVLGWNAAVAVDEFRFRTEKLIQGELMLEPNAPTLIKMEGVKKVFLTDEVETHALEEIHLEIKKGTYISIAGPSGCGKSTLLSILGLLDSPSDGSYMLNGQPVGKLTISERTRIRNREIGFIFQAFNLIGDLTVYENVE